MRAAQRGRVILRAAQENNCSIYHLGLIAQRGPSGVTVGRVQCSRATLWSLTPKFDMATRAFLKIDM